MAIPKLMRAAIRALSQPDLNIKKNYHIVRSLEKMKKYMIVDPVYRPWDQPLPCGDHNVPLRVFEPEADRLTPNTILFFHGGGWVTGDIDSYTETCVTMTRMTGYRVISVDYRLAPEFQFPAAPEDCYAAAREIFQNAGLFRAKPENIVLMGDSAGGNLAAVTSLMGRDRQTFRFQKQILIYPSTGNDHGPETSPYESIRENGTGNLLTAKRVEDYIDLYKRDDKDLSDPYFAPLLAEDLSGQPETLILTAELDPLRDEGEAYGERLREAGGAVEVHRIPDAMHGYFSMGGMPQEKKLTYAYINRFLSEGVSSESEADAVGAAR